MNPESNTAMTVDPEPGTVKWCQIFYFTFKNN